jgi:heme-degrading monooxygenase HmoA
VDRETGKGLTATFWESEEAMKASEEAADQLRDEAVGAVDGSELVSVERYEVELDER